MNTKNEKKKIEENTVCLFEQCFLIVLLLYIFCALRTKTQKKKTIKKQKNSTNKKKMNTKKIFGFLILYSELNFIVFEIYVSGGCFYMYINFYAIHLIHK